MRVLIFLCALFMSFPVVAQDNAGPSKTQTLENLLDSNKKTSYRPLANSELYKDIPSSYITEAQNFYETCQSDYNLFQFYNCKCLSVKYLDTRIESGSGRDGNSILLSLSQECRDGTYAAGHEYENCMRNGTIMFSQSKTPEEYCACLGNEVAKLYEASSVLPGTHSYVRLMVKAHSNCQ